LLQSFSLLQWWAWFNLHLNNIWSSSVFQLLMIFSFWWSSDASDDVRLWWLASEERASDDVSFRTTCLQNLFSSVASSFLLVDSIALICSFRTYALIKTLKILSMVLRTWTNISIFNWQFLTPSYHQNLKGNVKHILFQQIYLKLVLFLRGT